MPAFRSTYDGRTAVETSLRGTFSACKPHTLVEQHVHDATARSRASAKGSDGVKKSESSSTMSRSGTLLLGSACREHTYFRNSYLPHKYRMWMLDHAASSVDEDAGRSKPDLVIRALEAKNSTRFP